MTTRISPRDWEALSAYLDNQLNPAERSRVETRLQAEVDLRIGLEDMRRTRTVVRSARKYRAPRNFTLTTSMVGSKRGSSISPGAFPVLRLASVLATFFFVLITVGSFAARIAQPSQIIVMSSELEAARDVPPPGMGGGGGGSGEVTELAPAPTLDSLSAEVEQEGLTAEANTKEVTPLVLELATPTTAAMQALAVPVETEAPEVSAAAEEPAASVNIIQPGAQEEPQTSSGNIFAFIGAIQVALAVLALITGILALIVRRKSIL